MIVKSTLNDFLVLKLSFLIILKTDFLLLHIRFNVFITCLCGSDLQQCFTVMHKLWNDGVIELRN